MLAAIVVLYLVVGIGLASSWYKEASYSIPQLIILALGWPYFMLKG